jgi:hypothetical protein
VKLAVFFIAFILATCNQTPTPPPAQSPVPVVTVAPQHVSPSPLQTAVPNAQPTAVSTPWVPKIDFAHGAPISLIGCNDVAFSQMPNDPSTFISRRFNWTDASCQQTVSIDLVYATLGTDFKFTQGAMLLPGGSTLGDGVSIFQALDPVVMFWKGTKWVAFECVEVNGAITSICAGGLNADGTFNLGSSRVLLHGDNQRSMSEPKLVVYNDRAYVCTTRVSLPLNGVESFCGELGISLDGQLSASGLQHVWAGDIFQVIAGADGTLYVTGGLGCAAPLDGSNCYILHIGRVPNVLSNYDTDAQWADLSLYAPYGATPGEYCKLVKLADGKTYLMGGNGCGQPLGFRPDGTYFLGGSLAFPFEEKLL